MKKLFIRVGMTMEFTEEEYDLLVNGRLDNDTMLEMLKIRAEIDGDTYIPQDQYEADDVELDDDIEFLF